MLASAYKQKDSKLTLELSSNVCHFLVYSLLLKFLDATCPNVGDELCRREDEYLPGFTTG
jgi:hypothetical protein